MSEAVAAAGGGAAEVVWRREYPQRPIVGVAGVVLDGERVLLVRRGRAPGKGSWSLPGGALEVGETMAEGVAREVWEETGLRVRVERHAETLERVVRDDEGRVQFHYVLVDWVCAVDGDEREPRASGDAAEAMWVGVEAMGALVGMDAAAAALVRRLVRDRRQD